MTFRFLLLGLALLLAAPAQAEDIAVIVNGQVVSDYDVEQRHRLLSLSGKGASRDAAMQELINERLKLQEAQKLKVDISDAQVEKAFANIAERSKLSAEDFTHALQSRGVDARTLKNRLRAELSWQGVVRAKARAVMNIREQDILDALKKKGQDPDNIKSYEFQIMQAMVFVPKGSGAAVIADRRHKAESLRASIKGCDAAKQKALAIKDAAIKDPVRRNGNEISANLRELLEKTPVGGTTAIQNSEGGYEFILVCGKKEISGSDGAKAQMRTELMAREVDQASDRLLRELKEKASIDYRKK